MSMIHFRAGRLRWPSAAVLVPVVLGALTLFYMTPFLFPPTGNEVLNGHDLLDQQYPLLSFIFDSVRNGQGVPWWNPYQLSGESIIGNPQALLFYPPAWLLVPLGVPKGVGWLAILHLWLGAWGMAAFVRRLGASWAGALAGACVYAFSAVLGARLDAGHINYILCQAWLPWTAAAYLWSTERPAAWQRALLTGAALGLAALTGSTHLLHLGAVWLGALWLYVTLQAPPGERLRAALRALWPLALAGAGGMILGAVVLLPAASMASHSARVSQGSLAYSNSFALPGSQLITLIFPNMLGEPHLPDHGYWGLPFYEENTFYVGILPLVALFLARRRPAKTWLVACLVVGLVVSLGIQGGLFTVLYWLLPGYRLFRVPPRALYFVAVGAAGLMALWVTDLQSTAPDERARRLAPALRWGLPGLGAFALLASFAFTFYYSVHSGDEMPPWRALYSANVIGVAVAAVAAAWLAVKLWAAEADDLSAPGPQAALVVTLGVVLIDLWHITMPMVNVSAVDVPPLWQTIARVAPSNPDFRIMIVTDAIDWQNGATYTHHLSTGGYEQLVDAHYARLLKAAGPDPLSRVAQLLGVRYAAHNAPLPDSPNLKLLSQEQGQYVYEVRNTFPRAFVAPAAQVVADDQSALAQLSSGQVDPLRTALLDHPAGCPTGADTGLPARITYYSPNAVAVAADSPSGGVLVISDAYDSGWIVSVDSRPAPLLRVDVALRGVCVPSGAHRVDFTYSPRLLWIAGLLSGGAWAALGLTALWGLVRRFQTRGAATSRSLHS
jgi:hypothetical protein